eukprot:1344613-Rhodomonas_salina.4
MTGTRKSKHAGATRVQCCRRRGRREDGASRRERSKEQGWKGAEEERGEREVGGRRDEKVARRNDLGGGGGHFAVGLKEDAYNPPDLPGTAISHISTGHCAPGAYQRAPRLVPALDMVHQPFLLVQKPLYVSTGLRVVCA